LAQALSHLEFRIVTSCPSANCLYAFMQCTTLILAALLGLPKELHATPTGDQLTDHGHCLGEAMNSANCHASSLPSLLQVKAARADDLSKVLAAEEHKRPSKCNSTVKSSDKKSWEDKLYEETSFWDSYIESKGQEWARFNRDVPIAPAFRPYLELPDNESESTEVKFLNVLVVGSGPGSDIGYSDYEDAKVNLVLTDPLAKIYDDVFKKQNAYPPHQIMNLAAEELECFFQPDVFNLVDSTNALDHAYDPVEALRQMVRVTAPCAWIIVELFENEANVESGNGLHQWNFHMNGSRLALGKYNTTVLYDLTDEMSKVGAELSATKFEGCWLNGNCLAMSKPRLRIKIRKLLASGEKCPVSRASNIVDNPPERPMLFFTDVS